MFYAPQSGREETRAMLIEKAREDRTVVGERAHRVIEDIKARQYSAGRLNA